MKIWLISVLGWLRGRKTYLLVGLLFVTVVVLIACNRVTADTAFATVMIFAGLFAASYRDALAQNQAQAIRVAEESAALLRAVVGKNPKAAEAAGLALAIDGPQLVAAINKEAAKS